MSELTDNGRLYASQAWCQAIEDALGIQTVRAKQADAPAPTDVTYASVYIYDVGTRGYPDINYTGTVSLTETLTDTFFYVVEITFFRSKYSPPLDLARNLRQYITSAEGREFFRNKAIGVNQIGSSRDLSQVFRAEWEERSRMEIHFCMKAEYISTVPEIASVEIEGEFEADGTTYQIEG